MHTLSLLSFPGARQASSIESRLVSGLGVVGKAGTMGLPCAAGYFLVAVPGLLAVTAVKLLELDEMELDTEQPI